MYSYVLTIVQNEWWTDNISLNAVTYWNNVLAIMGVMDNQSRRSGAVQELWDRTATENDYREQMFAQMFVPVCRGTSIGCNAQYGCMLRRTSS